jgi:hypothetical protein
MGCAPSKEQQNKKKWELFYIDLCKNNNFRGWVVESKRLYKLNY